MKPLVNIGDAVRVSTDEMFRRDCNDIAITDQNATVVKSNRWDDTNYFLVEFVEGTQYGGERWWVWEGDLEKL